MSISRRKMLGYLGTACAASLFPEVLLTQTGSQCPPNILFILTDDQASWAWGMGMHPAARTPNLNRFAEQGVILRDSFVTTPVCSPSRAGLLTGRYATEVGITDWLSASRQPELGLNPDLPAWPELLQEQGYATALFGKWHLGARDRYLSFHFGYQEFRGWRAGVGISKDPKIETDGKLREVKGFTPDILMDYSLDFIRRNKDRPFLVSLHHWAPHANTENRTPERGRTWLPLSDADWNQFKETDPSLPEPDYPDLDVPRAKRMTREYLASVASVDRNFGRLMASLEELNLERDTIVVFSSDHGYNIGHHGIWHKGNGRWLLVDNQGPRPNLWDTSLRVPAIIRWPGRIRSDRTLDNSVLNLDWFPTLMDLAGIEIPGDLTIRGSSFAPALTGTEQNSRRALFFQYAMWDWDQTGADLRAYRTPDWKLIRDFRETQPDELYNLQRDPHERENLLERKDPETVEEFRWLNAAMIRQMDSIDDPAI